MEATTISKAASKAGVGIETIRFYERKGLIEQPRRPKDTGFRTYPEETVRRIVFIRRAQTIGFSLREIEELLELRSEPNTGASDVRAQAIAKRDEVKRKIADLQSVLTALDNLISACAGQGTIRNCSIIEALELNDRNHGSSGK